MRHNTSGMVVFPPCKINLGLQILSKRADGYHAIETCFYPLPWTDILEVIKSTAFSFSASGLSVPGTQDDNICLKAYHLLRSDFDLPAVKIHLHKVIPMGAGLGGGSSDGAYVLRALNTIFDLNLQEQTLCEYAARLGSDCAFFIQDKPMLGSGRGEVLTPTAISLKGMFIVLVKPEIHVSTAEAYAGVKPRTPSHSVTEIIQSPIAIWRNLLVNDFEESVFVKYPSIKTIKETLYRKGAVYASMSGSGASVFGIFNSPVDLKEEFAGTYWSGALN